MEQKTLSIVARAKAEGENELKKMASAVNETADAVKKSSGGMDKFTKTLDNTGKKMSDVGGSMATRLTLPIVAAGGAALKMSTDFNAGMANIATLIPGNIDRVNELKGSIQTMAMETGKSTADLSDGMYNVISAFGDTADSVKILEVNAKAAKAGLAQTTDAINLTSGVTKAYGDTTGEAVQKASDLALMTVRLGQTTFPELAASMGRVTPLAASLKVSQEELFGAMATFTGVTGGAAEVSTQLRGVLQGLMAPTADMKTLMDELGVANGEAMIKQFGMQGSIEKIMAAAEKSGKPLQSYLSSIEAQTLALAATGGQADNFREKVKQMGDVAGTTDQAFQEVTEGVNKTGFQMEQARAKMEVASQTMGDALAPALSKVADTLSSVAEWFMKLTPEGQKTVLMVAGITAAIAPMLIILGKMMQGVSAAIKIVQFLGKSWIGTGVKAVASAIKTSVVWTAQMVKIAAVATAQAAKTAAMWVGTQIKMVAGAVATGASYVAAAVAAAAAWVIANAAMLGVIGLIIAAVAGLVIVVVKNWDTIKAAAVAVWNFIKQAAVAVFEGIKTAIMFYINAYILAFQMILTAAKAVWNGIKIAASFVFELIKNVITTYINAYIAIFKWIGNAARNIWNGIASGARWLFNNIIMPVFNGIRNFIGNVFNGVRNTFENVKNFAVSMFQRIRDGVGSAFGNIVGTVTSPFKAAFNGIARLWNNSIGKLSFTAPDWVPGLGGKGFSMPKLPMLATGGIVTAPTQAIIGEGREPEAVLPLSKLDRMLENAGGNNQQEEQSPQINVSVTVNGTVIGDESSIRNLAVTIGQQLENQMRAQGTRNVNMLRANT